MGFYGNIADSSHIHFQFDKVFSSRTAMDRACLSGADGIYAGRFVLVKYDSEVGQSEIKYGYFGVNENSNVLYRDAACTMPYIYTTFSSISGSDTNSADWASYYVRIADGNSYVRLANELEFQAGQDYWVADAADGHDVFSLVSYGTIVYLRDTAQAGALTNTCLFCTGTTSGAPATWSTVSDNSHYKNYFDNYELDQRTYGDGFHHKGYDATVWQKTYNEGSGKFVQIASLNAGQPSFEFIQDPPSTQPASATIDPASTEDVYKIRVPTHWGFQIKEAEGQTDPDTDITTYPLSDQTDDEDRHLEIYMNLGGTGNPNYHVSESNVDDRTNNEVLLTPTGISGTLYNGEPRPDLMELSIHLPAIGNMIDQGYDLIYGSKNIIDEQSGNVIKKIRQRDIAWYPATSTDLEKQEGNSLLGGKTYDLTTFAGAINTAHSIIGQIIYDLPSMPNTDTDKRALSNKYLYRFNNKYYRKGTKIDEVDAVTSDFVYDDITPANFPEHEKGVNFPGNKYYVKRVQNGNTIYEEATEWQENTTYALKNLRDNIYSPVALEHFIQGEYYLKDGDNYICDYESEYPTYPDRKYYQIPENAIRVYYQSGSSSIPYEGYPYVLEAEYDNDGSFYTYTNDRLSPSYSEEPSLNIDYYAVADATAVNSTATYYYYPGIYYYSENNRFHKIEDSIEAFPKATYPNYYRLQFSDTPQYGMDSEGNIVQYYTMIDYEEISTIFSFKSRPALIAEEVNPLTGVTERAYEHLYILDETTHEYIPFSHIGDMGTINGRSPYAYPYVLYSLTVNKYDPHKLFLPGAYWYKHIDAYDTNNEPLYVSYLKDRTKGLYDENYWYEILDDIEINPAVTPFYLPDKYWYEPVANEFVISNSYLDNTQYYTKKILYVKYDRLNQCPPGFRWSDYTLYIPPSITLCSYEETVDLIEIKELGKDSNTLYGLLLALHKLYSADDDKTRDINTVRGAYNALSDMLYQIKKLKPERLLYVNNFGQIDSLEAGSNKLFMTDANGHIQTVTLSELKTLLNNV